MVSLTRLLVGGLLVFAILVPVYAFLLRSSDDGSIAPVQLRDTPAVDGTSDVGATAGKLAPDFDISTPDGTRVRLSELRGRPLLINFWATWCASCLSEMPDIKALQEEYGYDTFSVLAINAGETRDEALEFIDFLDAPFIYALDPSLIASDAYGVYGLPLSVFIDSGGVIRAVYRGHANRERLGALMTAAIEARPPGDLPVVLRLITTIPRERVLVVATNGPGGVQLTSRSLRCDPSYCALTVIDELESVTGIRSLDLAAETSEAPSLSVSYDPDTLTEAQVVDWLAARLGSLNDPVYSTQLQVRYAEP